MINKKLKMKLEYITKILNTAGNEISKQGKIPNHAYVYFICEKCGKQDNKKQRRRIAKQDDLLLCPDCSKKYTNQKKYGYDNAQTSPDVKSKISKSSKENNNIINITNYVKKKYGVDNIAKVKEIAKSRAKTKRDRVFISIEEKLRKNKLEILNTTDEYIGQRLNNKNIKYNFKCLTCNTEFKGTMNGHIPSCPTCYSKSSKPEKEVGDFIKEIYDGEVIENSREIIPPLELDIYLPEYNLAIEFDGLYWHSIEHKEKEYHLRKTEIAESKGIQILHIFEDEWRDKQEIVKNIIKYKLRLVEKVYARKTIFEEISSLEAKEFLNAVHIDGFHGAKYHYGLFYENELVAVISIGKSRYNKNYDWEIVRAGYKYRVVGGLSKLLKNFRKLHGGSVITYANRRYFDGKGYSSVGFKFIEDSQQNYYYTDFINRYSRVMFQKHKLSEKLENFDNELTEKENMINNGFSIIYDVGNKVFVL